jgi:hypothetical protein
MDRIFLVRGQKGAPRNDESMEYDVKRTPRMSRRQKGMKYFILLYFFKP